jgi:aspartate/methionine/tyrosine aminotransferase
MTMALPPFKLERYFAQHEFQVKYLLSASDCEALSMSELLLMADPDSLKQWEQLSLGYTESQGLPALRDEVRHLYPSLNADDVLILTPEEGIFIAMNTLLDPGDHMIAISPAYQSLYEIARARGVGVTPWRVRPMSTGWHLDIDELVGAITDRTRVLVINFPHNPTGYLPTQTEFDAIMALAARHGLYVFSDEMYRLLEYVPQQRLPAVCALPGYERGISLSGLSKSFALPGLRIGWLATRDTRAMQKWLAYKDYTTICSSAPSEVLALMALRARAGTRIVQRNLAIVQSNIATAEGFFVEFPELFGWRKPKAGSVAFVEWRGQGTVESFCQAVLDRKGVMIVPGSLFDVSGNYFRLGLGRRNFSDAIAHVHEYLIELNHAGTRQ